MRIRNQPRRDAWLNHIESQVKSGEVEWFNAGQKRQSAARLAKGEEEKGTKNMIALEKLADAIVMELLYPLWVWKREPTCERDPLLRWGDDYWKRALRASAAIRRAMRDVKMTGSKSEIRKLHNALKRAVKRTREITIDQKPTPST